MKCPACDSEFKSYTAISLHYRNKHGSAAQFREIMRQKYVDENHGGITPTCKCGCGAIPKYYDYERGYVEFVKGHHARIHNNWGHNEAALQKSQDKRREQIAAGEWTPWNKGETKTTDERVAAYGKTGSHTLKTDPDCQKQRAEHMVEQWKTGSITPLTGPAHSQWKGGVSSLQQLVRSYLFRVWSRPIMERDRFTCQKCGKQGDLCVHHDKERFAAILQKAMHHFKVFDATQLTFEMKQELSLWVIDYHLDNKVSGNTLCVSCHNIEHGTH